MAAGGVSWRQNATLRGFLDRIERQYGKARRTWLMDRGVPTEEVLSEMHALTTSTRPPAREAPAPIAQDLGQRITESSWLLGKR
jgi:hypothetical protein